jgi:hypothetical protein
MEEIYRLDARHRPRLWAAMMHARAAENTNISFEGMLSHTELAQMEGVGHEESDVLKRSTLQPKRIPDPATHSAKRFCNSEGHYFQDRVWQQRHHSCANGGEREDGICRVRQLRPRMRRRLPRCVLRVARRTDNDRSFAKLHPGRPTDQLTVENSARPIHRVLIAMAVLDRCSSHVYNAAQSSNET